MSPADQVRQVAKWVIAAFAVVGGALTAGVPISNLGALSGERLVLAIAAAAVGVAGIFLAVAFVSKVLDPKEATTYDLRQSKALAQRLREEPTFYGGFSHATADALIVHYEKNFAAYREAQLKRWDSLCEVENVHVQDGEERAAAAPPGAASLDTAVEALREEHEVLENVVQFWRRIVIYEQTKSAYRHAKLPMIVGAVLAAVGLIGFAYAANPAKHEQHPLSTLCAEDPSLCVLRPGPRGDRGPRGPQGPRGPRGPEGQPDPSIGGS